MIERMNRKAIRNFQEYEEYLLKTIDLESEKFKEIDDFDQALTKLNFYEGLKRDYQELKDFVKIKPNNSNFTTRDRTVDP